RVDLRLWCGAHAAYAHLLPTARLCRRHPHGWKPWAVLAAREPCLPRRQAPGSPVGATDAPRTRWRAEPTRKMSRPAAAQELTGRRQTEWMRSTRIQRTG